MTRLSTLLIATALLLAACAEPTDEPGDTEGPGDLLRSSLERDANPDVDADTRARLSADNRAFAFDLLHQIRADEPGENIFYSPHSISIALAMAYGGASGGTYDEMGEVLRFTLDEDDLHRAFNALDLDLATRGDVDVEEGDPPTLRVLNATWGQYDYPFSDSYLDKLAVNYGAGLRAVDFISEPEENRLRINEWVEEKTEGRIEDLLPEEAIDSLTRLVLTNAIYFLAGWEYPFDEDVTDDRPFTLADGTTIDAPIMRQNEVFGFYQGDQTRAASLPYVGGDLSFIALKPADPADFDTWADGLDQAHFDAVIDGLSNSQGTVSLPKFELEGDYDLKGLFESMGWTNYHELAGMVEEGFHDELEISAILHKSFISLDEEGTEAAAATAVIIRDGSAPQDPIAMAFDRPFIYAIYDHPTDSILFLGEMVDPTQ